MKTTGKENTIKIIRFYHPNSANVKAHIGNFFKILKKSFPKNHQFYKVFHKNTQRSGYRYMENMETIISSHNQLRLKPSLNTYCYNCMDRNNNKCNKLYI